MSQSLHDYKAKTGKLLAVWTLEIQTLPEEVDRILDAVMQVYPLRYGRYERNASVSAPGKETAMPMPGSTTLAHVADYSPQVAETYVMVELKISIERDLPILEKVMDAICFVHHYEEPVIFIREDWVSRSNYRADNDNPNRFWNSGRTLHRVPLVESGDAVE